MNTDWNFRQQFSARASTMLLIYLFVVIALDSGVSIFPDGSASLLYYIFVITGQNLPLAFVCAAIFAFAFFAASLWNRRPQVQYAIELLLAIASLMLLPYYY